MRYLTALSLVLLLTSCHTGQERPLHQRQPQPLDRLGPRVLMPFAMYDGIFASAFSAGAYFSHPVFFDSISGHAIRPSGITVSLNGMRLPDSIAQGRGGQNSNQALYYPQPVTWSLSGSGYPSFTHTLATQAPITFLAPITDSIRTDAPIEIRYTAPGSDSLTVHLTYWGIGNYRRDTTHVPVEVASSFYYPAANNGHFIIPIFIPDSRYYRSFRPTKLFVHLIAVRGDTIHADEKIFGFISQVATANEYWVKQ